jgi:hypothetical protein
MIFLPFVSFLLKLTRFSLPLLRGILFGFSCKDPPLILGLHLTQDLVSGLGINVHQNESVSDKVVFDKLVQRSIGCKTWRMVYFKQVTLIVGINHEVKP